MNGRTIPRPGRLAWAALAAALATGCASVNLEQNLARVNDETAAFTGGTVSLSDRPSAQAGGAALAARVLAHPLGQQDAVQLTLAHSPAMQALLAQGWAEAADAAQTGRIANPVFSFERLTAGSELELSRALSLGLLDLLTLPLRAGMAERRIEQAQLRLAAEVVDRVTQVRQAWVRAVAAEQSLGYARQVLTSAEASAELARRMQAVGNFNRLTRAREQAFYADAATRLANAQHLATANREALVRLIGLDEAQAQALRLPARLPDLPAAALTPEAVGALATRGRLDVRLAHGAWVGAGRAQGLNLISSLTDIELTARRNTVTDEASGSRATSHGLEIGVRLPLFDAGGLQRDAWNARTQAAAWQLEDTLRAAGSSLRENYSAYRTAYDLARHYRDEVLPVRRVISDENLLRYNGMLIGVFELLADARDQVGTVVAAIGAQQQFWLADAALQAAVIGRPTLAPTASTSGAPASGGAAAAH
jgi:outer membrane protein TolC